MTSRLPATLSLGPVSLTVTNLDRSVAWYQAALGLRVHRHEADHAALKQELTRGFIAFAQDHRRFFELVNT